MAEGGDADSRGRTVVVGLVADPGLPAEIAQQLVEELPPVLLRRVHNQIDWKVGVTCEGLPLDSADRVPLVDKAREKMPNEGWDLMVCLTDLPRRDGTRPVVADLSRSHGAALVSLPAIGWVRKRAHVRATIVHVLGVLAQQTLELKTERGQREGHHHVRRRPTEKVSPVRQITSGHEDVNVHLALSGLRGRARLLFGMVYDNRPWRLLLSLARAFAAAAATAAFGVFYSSIWGMADALSTARLCGITLFAIGIMVGWFIAYNNLWEYPRRHADREKVVLYNLATVFTLFFGVACLYLLLFTVTLLAALAIVSADYLQAQLGHPVGISDYVSLVWLASSMGTVAGALGSSLETEDAVRQATYSKRERERRARNREREQREQGTG